MGKNKKKLNLGGRSLMVRTWAYFAGMTVIILVIMWMTALILFHSYYTAMRENVVVSQCSALSVLYDGELTENFKTETEKAVVDNTMRVTVFTVSDGKNLTDATAFDITVIMSADPLDDSIISADKVAELLVKLDDNFLNQLQSSGRVCTYHLRNRVSVGARGQSYNLVVGCTKTTASGKAFIIATAPIMPTSEMNSLMINQLLIVTLVCGVVSVALSYFFSKSITKPITQYASVAQKMARGDKVRFGEVGFIEYDELARALNHANDELDKTEKMRREFMANVSHDLRTPLTMVKAYAEMIRDLSGRNEQKRTEHCEVIIDEVDRLTLLVNDILELSKLQSGTRIAEYKIIDLSKMVGMVIERFAIYRDKHGYSFELACDADCFIRCDERMIEQVLYNLIGNAVSYTGDDKKVKIALRKRDGKVIFAVTDTGRGIAPSEKEKVWDRYYRSNQTKRAVVGSGMGLSIVKNILDMHKAEYGVESIVNSGSTFYFAIKEETQE